MLKTENINNDVVKALDKNYVFHSWSAQKNGNPLVIEGGLGCTLWDYEGKKYLDFSSQLINTNMGYQHPKIVQAIQAQAAQLCTIAPSVASYVRGEAAKRIIEHAPAGFKKVFFTNAGADANENAMRMARQVTGKDKILSGYRSYHGNTGAAIVATGDPRRQPNEFARGHVHFFNPYLYRSEFHATTEKEECERALHHLKSIIEFEGPDTIAAILLESIPGTAGILVPPKDYLKGVRALADEFGIMLILDEVMVGFCRTGKWFAFEHFDVVPDLITFAKGVNSGYIPAGGVIVSEKVDAYFQDKQFPGGLTYSGHPLAMASVVANIDAMVDEDIVGNAFSVGNNVLGVCARSLKEFHPVIGDVRGMGMFWALELVSDPAKKTPVSAEKMAVIKSGLLKNGLMPFVAGNRIHLAPPCIMTEAEVKKGIDIIDQTLRALV